MKTNVLRWDSLATIWHGQLNVSRKIETATVYVQKRVILMIDAMILVVCWQSKNHSLTTIHEKLAIRFHEKAQLIRQFGTSSGAVVSERWRLQKVFFA
jgi:hypothetical protein